LLKERLTLLIVNSIHKIHQHSLFQIDERVPPTVNSFTAVPEKHSVALLDELNAVAATLKIDCKSPDVHGCYAYFLKNDFIEITVLRSSVNVGYSVLLNFDRP
jgi:hypothetical protein